jgi:hypothetical protein
MCVLVFVLDAGATEEGPESEELAAAASIEGESVNEAPDDVSFQAESAEAGNALFGPAVEIAAGSALEAIANLRLANGGRCRCVERSGTNPPVLGEGIASDQNACKRWCRDWLGLRQRDYIFEPQGYRYCGDKWSKWRNIPNGVGNPCPRLGADCTVRGIEIGKDYRTVDFFRAQDKTKFQCFANP